MFSTHRFTLSEYEKLVTAGIFTPEDRVELIRGEFIDMSPMGENHIVSIMSFTQRLVLTYHEEAEVLVQCPVIMSDNSAPEPDFALLKKRDYSKRKPHAEDVLLLIEISDSTLSYDREVKLPLYAESGVPEVWLQDVKGQKLEVYREPNQNIYRTHLTYLSNESVRPLFSKTPINWNNSSSNGFVG